MPRKYYFGNYPNSSDYDPNIPIGWNRWDAEQDDDELENISLQDDEPIDEEIE